MTLTAHQWKINAQKLWFKQLMDLKRLERLNILHVKCVDANAKLPSCCFHVAAISLFLGILNKKLSVKLVFNNAYDTNLYNNYKLACITTAPLPKSKPVSLTLLTLVS